MRTTDIVAGVFVGGPGARARIAKSLPIVERWRDLFAELGIACVLVGDARAYEPLGIPSLDDTGDGSFGPLGGLLTLFDGAPQDDVVTVACDMPHVSRALIEKLVAAPVATAVAPRRDGRWLPFFAKWRVLTAKPHARSAARARKTSLEALLDAAGASELALDGAELDTLR